MQMLPSYESKSGIKLLILVMALLLAVASLFYSNTLVRDLSAREQNQIDLHAKALEFIANAEPNDNISFLFNEIIESNHNIPVILTGPDTSIINSRNIVDTSWGEDKVRQRLEEELEVMQTSYPPIKVKITEDYVNYIWYRPSDMLTRLKWYPYIQLGTVSVLVLIGYIAFSYFRSAEQDRVWAGMAKETAHQLGTPISSLMAWVDYLRETNSGVREGIIQELEKDTFRLQLITDRFSQIGSTPVLKPSPVVQAVEEIVSYLRPRISTKIQLVVINQLEANSSIPLNKPLFQWVIENMIKNAADAIVGEGQVKIVVQEDGQRVLIDISDDGKGISKATARNIFRPGFSTKKRGWGLGLTLAKRIINDYHKGKLVLKSSEPGKGTTFRISLPNAD